MVTKVNNAGLTTETAVFRVGQVGGPFTKRPSGKFKKGEPVMVRCEPYWIVRVMFGTSASIMQDRKFFSEADAKQFWASLPQYTD